MKDLGLRTEVYHCVLLKFAYFLLIITRLFFLRVNIVRVRYLITTFSFYVCSGSPFQVSAHPDVNVDWSISPACAFLTIESNLNWAVGLLRILAYVIDRKLGKDASLGSWYVILRRINQLVASRDTWFRVQRQEGEIGRITFLNFGQGVIVSIKALFSSF